MTYSVAGSKTNNVCPIYIYQNILTYFKFSRKGSYRPYNQQAVLYIKSLYQESRCPICSHTVVDSLNPIWLGPGTMVWLEMFPHTTTPFPLHQNTNCETDKWPVFMMILLMINFCSNFDFKNITSLFSWLLCSLESPVIMCVRQLSHFLHPNVSSDVRAHYFQIHGLIVQP